MALTTLTTQAQYVWFVAGIIKWQLVPINSVLSVRFSFWPR